MNKNREDNNPLEDETRGPMYRSIVRFFEEDGWPIHEADVKPVLSTAYAGRHGRWVCLALAREETGEFVFYSFLPDRTPVERRGVVAELCTRLNYELFIGDFEMDFEDGEIRFRTSTDVENGFLPSSLVRSLVLINVNIVDRFLPAFQALLRGDVSPEEAISLVENEAR